MPGPARLCSCQASAIGEPSQALALKYCNTRQAHQAPMWHHLCFKEADCTRSTAPTVLINGRHLMEADRHHAYSRVVSWSRCACACSALQCTPRDDSWRADVEAVSPAVSPDPQIACSVLRVRRYQDVPGSRCSAVTTHSSTSGRSTVRPVASRR